MKVTVTGVLVEALSNEEFVGFCKGSAILSMADGDLERAKGFLELAIKAKAPKEPPAAEKAPKKKPTAVDHGKIMALHNAGWSVAKIADEMRIAVQTVHNHINKNEEAGK